MIYKNIHFIHQKIVPTPKSPSPEPEKEEIQRLPTPEPEPAKPSSPDASQKLGTAFKWTPEEYEKHIKILWSNLLRKKLLILFLSFFLSNPSSFPVSNH